MTATTARSGAGTALSPQTQTRPCGLPQPSPVPRRRRGHGRTAGAYCGLADVLDGLARRLYDRDGAPRDP